MKRYRDKLNFLFVSFFPFFEVIKHKWANTLQFLFHDIHFLNYFYMNALITVI
jgi:hypothetical protein